MNKLQNLILNLKCAEQLTIMNVHEHNDYYDTSVLYKIIIERVNSNFVLNSIVVINDEIYVRSSKFDVLYVRDSINNMFVDLLYDLESIELELYNNEERGFTKAFERIELTQTGKVTKYSHNDAYDEMYDDGYDFAPTKQLKELYCIVKKLLEDLNVDVSEEYDLTAI